MPTHSRYKQHVYIPDEREHVCSENNGLGEYYTFEGAASCGALVSKHVCLIMTSTTSNLRSINSSQTTHDRRYLLNTSWVSIKSSQSQIWVQSQCRLTKKRPRRQSKVSPSKFRVLDLVQSLDGRMPVHDITQYQMTLPCRRLALWSWSRDSATTDRRGSKISTTAIPFLSGQNCPIQNRSTT